MWRTILFEISVNPYLNLVESFALTKQIGLQSSVVVRREVLFAPQSMCVAKKSYENRRLAGLSKRQY